MIYILLYLTVAISVPILGIFSDTVNKILEDTFELDVIFLMGLILWPLFVLSVVLIFSIVWLLEWSFIKKYSNRFYTWYSSKR